MLLGYSQIVVICPPGHPRLLDLKNATKLVIGSGYVPSAPLSKVGQPHIQAGGACVAGLFRVRPHEVSRQR